MAQQETLEEVLETLVDDYPAWAETCFMIRDKDSELVPLVLNDVQIEIGRIEEEELRRKGKARIYVLKGRQGGVSTDQQARALHLIWKKPGAMALTLAHNQEDTEKIFQVTRRAIQNFPPELLPKMGRSEAKEVQFKDLDSKFFTGTAGASRMGRGITLSRLHGSEFAFWNNPRSVLNRVSPALIPRGSVVVLETTPDAFDSDAHKFWRESVAGETGYRAVFFPWWKCDKKNYRTELMDPNELGTLSKEESTLVESEGLTLEEIKWRRARIGEMGRSEFMREYPEDPELCWITAGASYFDADTIQVLIRHSPAPLKGVKQWSRLTDEVDPLDPPYPDLMGGRIQIFDHRAYMTDLGIITEDVIMGSDVSEGIGGDRTTWVARAFPSWRLLSKFMDKKVEPAQFGRILARWGRYYGEALLIVEKNAHGITVLRTIRDEEKYPRRSIFHRTPLNQNFDRNTDYIGWTTTAESIPLMLDNARELIRLAHEGHHPPPCREFLLDALAVTDGKLNGRDVLVADVLAYAGRAYAVRRKVKVLEPLHNIH